ncbi:MAG: hypothetical protein ACFNZX_07085 [Actinomyces sp.]
MAPFRRDPAGAADPARPARRRRPTWRDPRLAGGLALIGAAVALGTWAVDAAADTQQVYILTRDVAPGQDLTADGILTLVDAHPGTDAYVLAGQLPEAAVAQRSLSAGELLPEAAVGIRTPDDLRPIVLEVSSGLPAGTGTGDVVDLWVLPATQVTAEEVRERAEVVAEHLTVSTIGDKGTSLIGKETTEVEVLVPADSVSAVLTAIGGDGALVLVPTGTGS